MRKRSLCWLTPTGGRWSQRNWGRPVDNGTGQKKTWKLWTGETQRPQFRIVSQRNDEQEEGVRGKLIVAVSSLTRLLGGEQLKQKEEVTVITWFSTLLLTLPELTPASLITQRPIITRCFCICGTYQTCATVFLWRQTQDNPLSWSALLLAPTWGRVETFLEIKNSR